MKGRICTLAALATAGLLSAILLGNQQNREMDRRQDLRRQREVLRWSQGRFIPITNASELERRLLDRVEAGDTNRLLEGGLSARLVHSVMAMSRAYGKADFDAFIEFRFPAPDAGAVQIKPETLAGMKSTLPGIEAVQDAVRSKRPVPSDRPVSLAQPLGVLEAWWYLAAPLARGFEEYASEPLYCLSCWREICPERFQVLVERRDHAPPDLLRIANRLDAFSSAMSPPSLGITVHPGPESLFEQGKPVLFVHCLIPVKLNHKFRVQPVLVSFYWSVDHKKFLPHRLAVLASESPVWYVF